MNLLDYLEHMKNLPNRFSNLAFWRSLRVFTDKVVEAFTYVNSWGIGIEKEQKTQNGLLTTHGKLLDTITGEVYAPNAHFNSVTYMPKNAYIEQATAGVFLVYSGEESYTFDGIPHHITCRASLDIYTDIKKTKTTHLLIPLAYTIEIRASSTVLIFDTTPVIAPYGIANFVGIYVSYLHAA